MAVQQRTFSLQCSVLYLVDVVCDPLIVSELYFRLVRATARSRTHLGRLNLDTNSHIAKSVHKTSDTHLLVTLQT